MNKFRITHPIKKNKSGEPSEMGVISFFKLIGIISSALIPIAVAIGWYVNNSINTALTTQQIQIEKAISAAQDNIQKNYNDKINSIDAMQAQIESLKDQMKEVQRQEQLLWQRKK